MDTAEVLEGLFLLVPDVREDCVLDVTGVLELEPASSHIEKSDFYSVGGMLAQRQRL